MCESWQLCKASSRHRPWEQNLQKQASAGWAPGRQSRPLNAYRTRKKHVGGGDAVSDCQRPRPCVSACGRHSKPGSIPAENLWLRKKEEMKERSLESGGRCIKLLRRDFRDGARLCFQRGVQGWTGVHIPTARVGPPDFRGPWGKLRAQAASCGQFACFFLFFLKPILVYIESRVNWE